MPAPDALDNLPVQEIIEALTDKKKAEDLMKRHNLTREQLLARAEFITRRLAAGIAMVNCV